MDLLRLPCHGSTSRGPIDSVLSDGSSGSDSPGLSSGGMFKPDAFDIQCRLVDDIELLFQSQQENSVVGSQAADGMVEEMRLMENPDPGLGCREETHQDVMAMPHAWALSDSSSDPAALLEVCSGASVDDGDAHVSVSKGSSGSSSIAWGRPLGAVASGALPVGCGDGPGGEAGTPAVEMALAVTQAVEQRMWPRPRSPSPTPAIPDIAAMSGGRSRSPVGDRSVSIKTVGAATRPCIGPGSTVLLEPKAHPGTEWFASLLWSCFETPRKKLPDQPKRKVRMELLFTGTGVEIERALVL